MMAKREEQRRAEEGGGWGRKGWGAAGGRIAGRQVAAKDMYPALISHACACKGRHNCNGSEHPHTGGTASTSTTLRTRGAGACA